MLQNLETSGIAALCRVKKRKIGCNGFCLLHHGIFYRSGLFPMMMWVISDGRTSFANVLPFHGAIRAFRARKCEITPCIWESKEAAKLSVVNFEQVQGFHIILQCLEGKHQVILSHSNRVWTIREIVGDTTYCKKEKIFTGANSHHGGYRAPSTNFAFSKRITAVAFISVSGYKVPSIL